MLNLSRPNPSLQHSWHIIHVARICSFSTAQESDQRHLHLLYVNGRCRYEFDNVASMYKGET